MTEIDKDARCVTEWVTTGKPAYGEVSTHSVCVLGFEIDKIHVRCIYSGPLLDAAQVLNKMVEAEALCENDYKSLDFDYSNYRLVRPQDCPEHCQR